MTKFLTAFFLCISLFAGAQVFNNYTTAQGMPSDNCRDVAVAANGNIWIATQNGVAMFDGSTIAVHNTATFPGLVNDDLTCIAVTANGNVWVGSDFGASVFDGSSYTTYTSANGLISDQVRNIKEAPNGDIWIGTNTGATLFSGGTFTSYGTPDIPFGGVNHFAFDGSDVLMSGGLSGIVVFDGSGFSTITTNDGLISNRIRSIAVDPAGNKWVATDEGITALDASNQFVAQHTRLFALPAPDTLNPVTDVALDNNGVVLATVYVDYLVTEGGLSFYNGSYWWDYDTNDGLAGPNVRRLAVDADNHVWVATSTGLSEIMNLNIGIEEQTVNADFTLFPNPTQGAFQFDVEAAGSVNVYDGTMRLVHTQQTLVGKNTIALNEVPSGLYYVRLGSKIKKLKVVR